MENLLQTVYDRTKISTHDGVTTKTSIEQIKTEKIILDCFFHVDWRHFNWKDRISLHRKQHVAYLRSGLEKVGTSFQSLDASRPWLCYWIIHALYLLDALPEERVLNRIAWTLEKCKHSTGGFGGGFLQLPHLATTYASVNALVTCGTEEALNIIDRGSIYKFLLRMKHPSGGFTMHEDGEVDVRGAYCALSVASMLDIITDELVVGAAEWVASCQTYEGGMGGEPFAEAHGGYTFCGFAALVILGKTDLIDKKALMKWAINKQMRVEGGFQGRTNKLVDACYSFWQGGLFPLLDMYLINPKRYSENTQGGNIFGENVGGWCFDQYALQEYILACAQSLTNEPYGGLMDKPGKRPDYYHTCYALSGLSVTQNNSQYLPEEWSVLGDPLNTLNPTHPVHNVSPDKIQKAKEYFSKIPFNPKIK